MSAIAIRKARIAAALKEAELASSSKASSPTPSEPRQEGGPSASTSTSPSSSATPSRTTTPSRKLRSVEEAPVNDVIHQRKKQRKTVSILDHSEEDGRPSPPTKAKGRYFAGLPGREEEELGGTPGQMEGNIDVYDKELQEGEEVLPEDSDKETGEGVQKESSKSKLFAREPHRLHEQYDWFSPVWKQEGNGEQVNAAYIGIETRPQSSLKGKSRSDGPPTIVLALAAGQTFSFQGIAELRILVGSATINGIRTSPFRSIPQTLFCPKTSPLPIIMAQVSDPGPHQSTAISTHEDTRSQELLRASGLDPTTCDCILSLTPVDDTGLEHLTRVCPLAGPDAFCGFVPGFASPATELDKEINLPFFSSVFASRAQSGTHSFHHTPSSWSDAFEALSQPLVEQESPQVILVRGPKGAGKSALARQLVSVLGMLPQDETARPETLLVGPADVAYMDLDLGQGEYGVPGSISLHLFSSEEGIKNPALRTVAPAWLTHTFPSVPKSLLAHYLGQTTPRDIPSLYLSAVQSLTEHYRMLLSSAPPTTQRPSQRPTKLIVNTMGWTKGLGAELAARVENIIRPDLIYDLTPTVERSSNYGRTGMGNKIELIDVPLPSAMMGPPYLDSFGGIVAAGPRVVPLQAIGLDLKLQEEAGLIGTLGSWPMRRLTPADQRILSIMTALHSVPSGPSLHTPRWDFSQCLLEQEPFVIDIKSGLPGGIQFFPPLARPVDVGMTLAALNGELVGLAVVRDHPGQESEEVQEEEEEATSDATEGILASWTSLLTPEPLAPAEFNFLSLALIRSIDPLKGHVHLLCPFPLSTLLDQSDASAKSKAQPKLALLKSSGEAGSGSSGNVELPIWASLDAPSILAARSGRLGVNAVGRGVVGVGVEAEEMDNKGAGTLAGVPLEEVPYLEWPVIMSDGTDATLQGDTDAEAADGMAVETINIVGKERRRVRRNLMRRNQG